MSKALNSHHNKSIGKYLINSLLFLLLIIPLCSCNLPYHHRLNTLLDIMEINPEVDKEATQKANSLNKNNSTFGSLAEESDLAAPVLPDTGSGGGVNNLPLKPVGFVNYGSINATVRAWSYIPPGAGEPQIPPPSASTVSSAQGISGNWPNSSRFISVPLGTYTWCIDWEEDDQDGDGYFDYYHYITTDPTLLDENDSDDLDLAEEVAISAPPDNAPIFKGKCNSSGMDGNCVGKDPFVQTFIGQIQNEPENPPDLIVLTDTNYRSAPTGIEISVSSAATEWYGSKILWNPGDWIEATTSDPYTAIGVQMFGDRTIGWARVLFDGVQIWEGDLSTCTIDADANNGLGHYGIFVETRCLTTGTHTIRVESSRTKEIVGGFGGWKGGVPVHFFGFYR